MEQSPERKIPITGYIFLIISLIGLGDAAYLFANYLAGESDICTVTAGCNIVLTSEYASILGVPLSLIGLLYYAVLFALSLAFIASARRILLKIAAGIAIVGFLFSIRLVYLQLGVLESVCEFCMVSAGLSTILAGFGVPVLFRRSRSIDNAGKESTINTSSHE